MGPPGAPVADQAHWRDKFGIDFDDGGQAADGKEPPPTVLDALSSEEGQPLADGEQWSQRIGADVGHARLVTGAPAAKAAAAIDARAFTVGHRVFFGAGAETDRSVLAHELTHVAQQRGGATPSSWNQLTTVPKHDPREQAAHRHEGQPAGGSAVAIARDDDKPVDAYHFLMSISVGDTIQRMFSELKVIQRGPFGQFLPEADLMQSFEPELFQDTIQPKLFQLLQPEDVLTMIDRSRVLDWAQPDENKPPVKTNKGSTRWTPQDPVKIEIANAVIRRYFESMGRMFPRVAAVSYQKNLNYIISPDRFVPWVDIDEKEIPVSHPMDVVLRKVLVGERQWLYDAYRFAIASGTVKPMSTDAPQSTTPAELTFVPNGKLWHWVRASPEDATREQVAAALFGKQEYAYRLIAMPPLWGFRAGDIKEFSITSFQAFLVHYEANKNNTDPALQPPIDIVDAAELLPVDVNLDPLAELLAGSNPSFAIDRFKQNTAGKPTDGEVHDEANVVDVLKGMLKNLDDLDKLLPLFHKPVDAISAARSKWLGRRDEAAGSCLKDAETAYRFADAPMTVEDIVGKGADLRTTQVAGAESIVGENMALAAGGDASKVLPHLRGVAPNRAHPDYGKVITALKGADVGGPTGAMDRSIIADSMFAGGSDTPTFTSVDPNVTTRLAKDFGDPTKLVLNKGDDKEVKLAATFPDGKFTITIEKHPLVVRFR